MLITYPLLTVVDDTGAIVSGATVTIASLTDRDGTTISSPGATLHVAGANVSVEYDAETKGEAWLTLAVSKAGNTITGTNASPSFYLSRDPSRIDSYLGGSDKVSASVDAWTLVGITTNITGNLSGTVGAVTGNVGGSVNSVTGDVGGKVLGGGTGTITGVGAQTDLKQWDSGTLPQPATAPPTAAQIDAQLSGTHGSGTWGGGTATVDNAAIAQAVYDKAQTTPIYADVRQVLGTAAQPATAPPTAAQIDAQLSGTHGSGTWGGGTATVDNAAIAQAVYDKAQTTPIYADVRQVLGTAAQPATAPPDAPTIAAAVRDASNASPAAGSLGADLKTAAGASAVGDAATIVAGSTTTKIILSGLQTTNKYYMGVRLPVGTGFIDCYIQSDTINGSNHEVVPKTALDAAPTAGQTAYVW